MSFLALQERQERDLLNKYFQLSKDAADHREEEIRRAIQIQRTWRGHAARSYVKLLQSSSLRIQCLWRGYRGRAKAIARLRALRQQHRKAFFDAQATSIQRVFRGFLSRKMVLDFYKRQKFVRSVTEQATTLNQTITVAVRDAQALQQSEQQLKDQGHFDEVTSNLHHLLSTRARPGVYQSVLGPEFHPTVNDIPVEEHIRFNSRAGLGRMSTQRKARLNHSHTGKGGSGSGVRRQRNGVGAPSRADSLQGKHSDLHVT